MKILHMCNLPLPEDHPDFGRIQSHPGRWALNLARAQAEHTENTVECLAVIPKASAVHVTVVDGIRTHFLPTTRHLYRALSLMIPESNRIARYITETIAPDFVHAHGTETSNLMAAERTRIPHIVTAQGLFFLIAQNVSLPLISWPTVVRLTEHLALRRAKACIAKSAYVADALAKRYPALKLFKIPNTYDPRLVSPYREKPPDHLVFVGNVGPRKGVDLIAEALPRVTEEFQKLTLTIIGNREDPSEYETEQLKKIRSILGIRARFRGIRTATETVREVAENAILLAPSREEMFGNQLVEALMGGTQPIVTEGTALAENVRRFGYGLIAKQNDPQDLADKMIKGIRKGGDQSSASTAYERVREWMGPQAVAHQHANAYQWAIDNP